MNCGRNDRKNKATFGFSTLTTTPCVNERRTLTPGWSGSMTEWWSHQRAHADVDEVTGAQPFDGAERDGGCREHGRQSGGGGERVCQVAEGQPSDGRQPGFAPVADAAVDDVQDRRAGDQ